MEKGIKFFYISFIIIGLILITISSYLFFDARKIIKNSIETTGIFEKLEDSNKYIIIFNTEDGKEVQSYSLYNNFIARFREGNEVKVFYNKKNPDDVKINSFISLWFVPVLILIIGLFLMFMSIIKFIMVNMHEKEQFTFD